MDLQLLLYSNGNSVFCFSHVWSLVISVLCVSKRTAIRLTLNISSIVKSLKPPFHSNLLSFFSSCCFNARDCAGKTSFIFLLSKTRVFGLPFTENRMIEFCFVELYFNATYRRTDMIIAVTALRRANAR